MFIVSQLDLVLAQCRAGIVGSFPTLNARPAGVLEQWFARLKSEVGPDDAPFAANLIVHRTNERLDEDLALCVKYEVPLVITSLGARSDVNEAIHSYGGLVLHDVTTNAFARKAIEKGADGLIAVAAGAGGHAGVTSPFALVSEIRRWFSGPLALSGSISNGASILAARALGADFAYMGSAFIATHEAIAVDDYKQMIVDCDATDIVYSNLFTGVHGNYLKPSIVRAGLDLEDLPQSDPSKMDFAALADGRKAWKDIWGCGQGIGAIDAVQPTAALIAQLKREYDAGLAALLPAGGHNGR
ncbi:MULTISPECIES: NAD(P)H-dependent flavin oxidoreductase [unclassified Sphingobium]|uniref:NAD(P)H-dependent flavin oxidoreductase n=1 Tax=Sphingobium TaxID=165695 RepID=UPI001C3FDAE0|nr:MULTISPECIES: nitronate monooxygenase family protein [unclassified Sphingobium]